MRIHVETVECAGHAQCYLVNPELYPIDDDGFSAILEDIEVPPGLEPDARRGADACPSRVITIIED
ncbi:MAG: hypothetical protein JWM76_3259 [Pseudonocardiales bacterium]|nr:hypothetical protein [Pseudonocardiales bacterium]